MDISGKSIMALAQQSGQGKNGMWKKQEYILETPSDKFPKKVCIAVWGDNIEKFNLREGASVTASIDIESREYNGRWYTDVKVWKVSANDGSSQDNYSPAQESPVPFGEKDDLPF